MNEQKAIEILTLSEDEKEQFHMLVPVYEVAVKALEEIQQYRAIGTVEECEKAIDFELAKQDKSLAVVIDEYLEYIKIGTIEEFKALKEKNEPIANGEWIDTQPGYNNGYYKNVRVCSNCNDYYTTEYDEMKFCPKCGAKMKEQD